MQSMNRYDQKLLGPEKPALAASSAGVLAAQY